MRPAACWHRVAPVPAQKNLPAFFLNTTNSSKLVCWSTSVRKALYRYIPSSCRGIRCASVRMVSCSRFNTFTNSLLNWCLARKGISTDSSASTCFFQIRIPERDDIFLNHLFVSLLFDRLQDLQAFLPVVVMLVPENLQSAIIFHSYVSFPANSPIITPFPRIVENFRAALTVYSH